MSFRLLRSAVAVAMLVCASACGGETEPASVSPSADSGSRVESTTTAADVCYRGLRQCGTPATESLAETGTPDGGSSYEQPIGAYCAAGTCKTHYL